jgi:tRNA (cmo5U34)-methyltransferase
MRKWPGRRLRAVQFMIPRDRLFESESNSHQDFVFDERVVRVFPDMIRRSIPGYGLVVSMTALLARCYAVPGTQIYDLGCSLGAVSLSMMNSIEAPGARILAVDNSPEMIDGLGTLLRQGGPGGGVPVVPLQQDILDTRIENASVVVLNFALQFIEPGKRDALLARILQGLNPGGVLLLSEKVRFEDAEEQSLQTEWHHEFKRAQGYSELEIARKRDALEKVMKPDSLAQHRARLEAAGFERVYQWYQGLNFASLLAFAPEP